MTKNIEYKASRPWWLIAGKHLNGCVLLSANLGCDNVKNISSMAEKVFILNSKEGACSESNVYHVNSENVKDNKYDAIIFDLLDREAVLTGDLKNNLPYLKEDGVVCFCQMNRYSLRGGLSSVFSSLTGFLFNKRIASIKDVFCKDKLGLIAAYPTVVYDGVVYESQLSTVYNSNKNSFLLKEKIKRIMYNSFLSSFMSDSYVYMIGSESSKESTLINQLINELKKNKEIKWQGDDIYPLKLFYKTGKLLLSLSSKKNRPEYIVVFCLNDEARKQRENEYTILQQLRKNGVLKNKCPKIHGSYCIDNVVYYVIQELEGVTVDEDNPSLDSMMESAYKLLLDMTDATFTVPGEKINSDFSKKILSYFEEIKVRLPVSGANYAEFQNLLINNLETVSVPMVCMHGDYKLENLILEPDTNNVVGVIDWELADYQGFPLIDLFYLIIYDMHIKGEGDMLYLCKKLILNDLSVTYKDLIKGYCERYSINSYTYQFMLALYFLHHFAIRYKFSFDQLDVASEYNKIIDTLTLNLSSKMIKE